MKDIKIYDEASLHYGGEWPVGLPKIQAYVHTGFYMGWIIKSGLYSEQFGKDYKDEIAQFSQRTITGPQLYQAAGGRFTSDMLNDIGNAFTSEYFDLAEGRYLKDYGHLLADVQETAYHVPDTWESYDRISTRIQQQFDYWTKNKTS